MQWFKSLFKKNKNEKRFYDKRIAKLEGIIGFEIDNPKLFYRALRHRSTLASEHYTELDSYERLEFLGDAVLDLIVSEILYEKYPNKDEGFLTKIRAKLVRGDALYEYSIKLGLDELLEYMDNNENEKIAKSILADIFESLIAAVYVTKGYTVSYQFVKQVLDKYVNIEDTINTIDNYKSVLLEYTQAEKIAMPKYNVVSEKGPGHKKIFVVEVEINGKISGVGEGSSKKKAEQMAASKALDALNVR